VYKIVEQGIPMGLWQFAGVGCALIEHTWNTKRVDPHA